MHGTVGVVVIAAAQRAERHAGSGEGGPHAKVRLPPSILMHLKLEFELEFL